MEEKKLYHLKILIGLFIISFIFLGVRSYIDNENIKQLQIQISNNSINNIEYKIILETFAGNTKQQLSLDEKRGLVCGYLRRSSIWNTNVTAFGVTCLFDKIIQFQNGTNYDRMKCGCGLIGALKNGTVTYSQMNYTG